jgi:hypothetical protein
MYGGSVLIREVAYGGSVLIREVAYGGSVLIRGVADGGSVLIRVRVEKLTMSFISDLLTNIATTGNSCF